jgi:hypothetical protein
MSIPIAVIQLPDDEKSAPHRARTPEILEITECDEDVESPKVSCTVCTEESKRDLFVCQKGLIQHVGSFQWEIIFSVLTFA